MAQGGDPNGNGTGGSGQNIVAMILNMREVLFPWRGATN